MPQSQRVQAGCSRRVTTRSELVLPVCLRPKCTGPSCLSVASQRGRRVVGRRTGCGRVEAPVSSGRLLEASYDPKCTGPSCLSDASPGVRGVMVRRTGCERVEVTMKPGRSYWSSCSTKRPDPSCLPGSLCVRAGCPRRDTAQSALVPPVCLSRAKEVRRIVGRRAGCGRVEVSMKPGRSSEVSYGPKRTDLSCLSAASKGGGRDCSAKGGLPCLSARMGSCVSARSVRARRVLCALCTGE